MFQREGSVQNVISFSSLFPAFYGKNEMAL